MGIMALRHGLGGRSQFPYSNLVQDRRGVAAHLQRMSTLKRWLQDVARDHDLEEHVRAELGYDPAVGHVGSVEITAANGVVSVTGTVYSLAQRWAVEQAVRRVAGVTDVFNDLLVLPPKDVFHSDEEIADAVATVLTWTAGIPDGIEVSVLEGCVTLDGTVASFGERIAAADVARVLVGVKGITNRLEVADRAVAEDIRTSIEAAIRRRDEARNIAVFYDRGTVTLGGTTSSWAERTSAEEAARLAPGVTTVVNRIAVTE